MRLKTVHISNRTKFFWKRVPEPWRCYLMFYCVKSHKKFKILDTFNQLLCYCGFALYQDLPSCTVNSHNRKEAYFVDRLC